MSDKYWNARQTAQRCDLTPDHFRRTWRRRVRRGTFPAPIGGLRALLPDAPRARWDPAVIEAYLAGELPAPAVAMILEEPPPKDTDDDEEEPEKRRPRRQTDEDRRRAAQASLDRLAEQNRRRG